ncbi:MAG: hypothetical protein U0Q21_12635 [Dermatophilaceae bacterium]
MSWHILGDRTRRLPAPVPIVWADLVERRVSGSRPWMELAEDEAMPDVLRAFEPREVVWSSLWPARPRLRIVLECLPADGETRLRFTIESPEAVDDPSAVGHYRRRMNELLFRDLRTSYGQ